MTTRWPAGSRSRATALVTVLVLAATCNGGTRGSDSPPDDDGTDPDTGSDSDSDSGTGSDTNPTEDLLPDWTLAWARQFGNTPGTDMLTAASACGQDAFVATGSTMGPISFDGYELKHLGFQFVLLVKIGLDSMVDWATWAGGSGAAHGVGLDSTDSGRVAVTGAFNSDAVFGYEEPNETTLAESADGSGAYQALYDGNGILTWARAVAPTGSLSKARGLGIAIAADGSVIGTGYFVGQAVLAEGSPAETTLQSSGEKNVFLVRYNSTGQLVWARCEGGPASTMGVSLAVLPDDSFVVLGTFAGEACFGQGEENETTLVPLGSASVFLARFDADGLLRWAIDLGMKGDAAGASRVGLLGNGDLAVTGVIQNGSMPAGDGEDVSPVEVADQGLFLARYTAQGSHVWTRVILTESSQNSLRGVAELSDGTLAAAGHFSGTAVFAAGEPGETSLQGYSPQTGFLASWTADGEFLWALRQGGTGEDHLVDAVAFPGADDGQDVLIAAGYFQYKPTYGTGGGDEVHLDATGDGEWFGFDDIVLLRFDREAQ